MLAYDFMRKALLSGLLLSIMIPIIGVVMVNRKTSLIGDALAHTSLAGVGLGLILGLDPTTGALFICLVAAFGIEAIRKRFPQYGDMATSVVMSFGLGLAAILSDFAPSGNTFEYYLFGSISSVTTSDLIQVIVVFVLVILAAVYYYSALLDIAIDPNIARLAGVPVSLVNGIFTALTAITIALATKIVGALLVASMMVLPVAAALFVSRSYRQTMMTSIALGVFYMMAGLTTSYYLDIKPGGAIVLYAILGFLLAIGLAKLRSQKAKKA